MTSSRVLKDYSKFKADDVNQNNNNNNSEDIEFVPEEDPMDRRRSSATVDFTRRRRSNAEVMLRSHAPGAAATEESGELLDFEVEIPTKNKKKRQSSKEDQLEGSQASLLDPFGDSTDDEDDDDNNDYKEDDEDTEEADVTDERDPSSRHNLLGESYNKNDRSAQSLQASASSLVSSTSGKRRTPRRRKKHLAGDDQSMSMSMPDLDSRYRYNYERKGNRSNGSLGEFLEKKGRSKTNLLPGSTTEDLCSEMNLAAARALQGSSSRVGMPKKSTPSRATTAPALMRRATADNVSYTPGSSRLRDYSQPQPQEQPYIPANPRRESDDIKNTPSKSLLRDYSQPQTQPPSEQAYIPANPRRDSKATIPALAPSPKDTDLLSPSMLARKQRRNTTAMGHSAPSNRRRSKSPHRASAVSPKTTGFTPRRARSHDGEIPMPEIATTKSRRAPPRSKSSDGATARRPARRTTSNDSNNHSLSALGTSGFITGSRIRRIQPGTGLSSSRSISPTRKISTR